MLAKFSVTSLAFTCYCSCYSLVCFYYLEELTHSVTLHLLGQLLFWIYFHQLDELGHAYYISGTSLAISCQVCFNLLYIFVYLYISIFVFFIISQRNTHFLHFKSLFFSFLMASFAVICRLGSLATEIFALFAKLSVSGQLSLARFASARFAFKHTSIS